MANDFDEIQIGILSLVDLARFNAVLHLIVGVILTGHS
jgi:hypothetical protein